MIHSVEIENFKNIRHQKINLERLTVFVGPNGCGKTSVLQAIHCAVKAVTSEGGHKQFFDDRFGAWSQSLDWLKTRDASGEMVLKYTTSTPSEFTIIPRPNGPVPAGETVNRKWFYDITLNLGFAHTPEVLVCVGGSA